jgi:hypothetical protein
MDLSHISQWIQREDDELLYDPDHSNESLPIPLGRIIFPRRNYSLFWFERKPYVVQPPVILNNGDRLETTHDYLLSAPNDVLFYNITHHTKILPQSHRDMKYTYVHEGDNILLGVYQREWITFLP